MVRYMGTYRTYYILERGLHSKARLKMRNIVRVDEKINLTMYNKHSLLFQELFNNVLYVRGNFGTAVSI